MGCSSCRQPKPMPRRPSNVNTSSTNQTTANAPQSGGQRAKITGLRYVPRG